MGGDDLAVQPLVGPFGEPPAGCLEVPGNERLRLDDGVQATLASVDPNANARYLCLPDNGRVGRIRQHNDPLAQGGEGGRSGECVTPPQSRDQRRRHCHRDAEGPNHLLALRFDAAGWRRLEDPPVPLAKAGGVMGHSSGRLISASSSGSE